MTLVQFHGNMMPECSVLMKQKLMLNLIDKPKEKVGVTYQNYIPFCKTSMTSEF